MRRADRKRVVTNVQRAQWLEDMAARQPVSGKAASSYIALTADRIAAGYTEFEPAPEEAPPPRSRRLSREHKVTLAIALVLALTVLALLVVAIWLVVANLPYILLIVFAIWLMQGLVQRWFG